jgi:hypothetical protein
MKRREKVSRELARFASWVVRKGAKIEVRSEPDRLAELLFDFEGEEWERPMRFFLEARRPDAGEAASSRVEFYPDRKTTEADTRELAQLLSEPLFCLGVSCGQWPEGDR